MAISAERALVRAMGLSFVSPLGVAAGVDRDGARLGELDLAGFGHIEIGTVMPGSRIAIAARPLGLRVGINFGSALQGLNDAVIDDYCAALREAYPHADYLCANLTAPRGGRDGDSAGVTALLGRLRAQRDGRAETSGCAPPLLVKVAAAAEGAALPQALASARRLPLDGVVFVCSDLLRIKAAKDMIGDLALISVGGVTTAEEAFARIKAGASLVQTCSVFLANGAPALTAIFRTGPGERLREHGAGAAMPDRLASVAPTTKRADPSSCRPPA